MMVTAVRLCRQKGAKRQKVQAKFKLPEDGMLGSPVSKLFVDKFFMIGQATKIEDDTLSVGSTAVASDITSSASGSTHQAGAANIAPSDGTVFTSHIMIPSQLSMETLARRRSSSLDGERQLVPICPTNEQQLGHAADTFEDQAAVPSQTDDTVPPPALDAEARARLFAGGALSAQDAFGVNSDVNADSQKMYEESMEAMARDRAIGAQEPRDYGQKVKQMREWIGDGGFPVQGSFANHFRTVHALDPELKLKYESAKSEGRKSAEKYRLERTSCTRSVHVGERSGQNKSKHEKWNACVETIRKQTNPPYMALV